MTDASLVSRIASQILAGMKASFYWLSNGKDEREGMVYYATVNTKGLTLTLTNGQKVVWRMPVSRAKAVLELIHAETASESAEVVKTASKSVVKTVGGIKWECSSAEGIWFYANYRICRSDRKGLRSQWELFRDNVSVWTAKTCGDLMQMVADNQI